MKKLFTLAAAVLASFSMWAADPAPVDNPATKKYGDITFLDVAGTVANRTDKEGKDYLTYGVYYVAKTKAITTWFNSSDGNPGSNHESTGYSITDAADFGFFPTSSTNTDINYGGTKCHSGRQRYFYVTGATSVAGIVRDGGTSSNKYAQMLIQTVAEDGTLGSATTIGDTYVANNAGYVLDGGELDPAKYYKISFTSPSSSNSYMYQIRLGKTANCTDPEFTISPTEGTGFVGDPIDITVSSKNQSKPINPSVTVDGVPGVYGTDYTFSASTGLVQATPLKAGTFVVTFSQASNGTYCAAEESATFVINEKTPVASVTIAGPASGFIGDELVYTATATGATAYEWYLDDVKQGSDSAKFIYTAVKGEHSIVCKARNQFNATDEWIASDAKAVTITKLCGELIKVSATAYNAATATGIFSGTTSASMSSKDSEKSVYEDLTGYKLNTKNTHLGITFNAGQTLQAGDVATIFVTTVSAKLQLFADKGTTLIGETDNVVQGENQIILGSAANGANGIYVYRTEAAGAAMNPFVAYVSVTRSCEESDNNNASVTINGEAAEKSGTVFNYTLSNSYTNPTVDVVITLEHPLATLMEDHAASFTMPTPEVGTPSVETFKVKAENGDQAWYSIFVNKAASLNDDATLSALSVEGYTLTPAFDAETTAYTITKAYKAANPDESKVSATPNDANAKAEVVLVDDVFTITVTAEDNTTTKVYTITILEADAPRKLNEIIFSNSYKGYLLNGQGTDVYGFYLEGKDAPTVQSCIVSEGATWAVVGNTLTVTGADSKFTEYTINLEAVSPMEYTADVVTLNGTESWVKGAYGFNGDKGGWLFSKTDDDFSREIAGKTHVELFLPATQSVLLKAGANGTVREVDIRINGVLKWEKKELTKEGGILVSGDDKNAFMLSVVSNQKGGDGGLGSIQLTTGHPTGMDNTDAANKAIKAIENGQIVIIKNGVRYNVLGAVLK